MPPAWRVSPRSGLSSAARITPARSIGHLLRALIEEGKRVAAAAGIELNEDRWEMNKIGAMTNHPPSILYDVRHQLTAEVDFLSGAIAREAERVGVPAPLHTRGLPPHQGERSCVEFSGRK